MSEYLTLIEDEQLPLDNAGGTDGNTLWTYYDGQMPSRQERGQMFQDFGLGDASSYKGEYQQNIDLLDKIKSQDNNILAFIDGGDEVSFEPVSNSFLQALAGRESGGNSKVVNSLGYAGKYQFGEQALADIGLYQKSGRYNNDWSGTWKIDGVHNLQDFLNNEAAQDQAQKQFIQKNWQYIKNLGLDKYVGRTVSGIPVTASGLLAAAHLGGVGSVNKFLKSGTANKDAYGTSVADYLRTFADYDVSDLIA